MVGIDSTFLSLMLHPKARPPLDPGTGKPLDRMVDRIQLLIDELDEDNERIIIPTPVLSEFLILAGSDASAYLDKLSQMRTVRVVPFDQVAAIELAAMENLDRTSVGKRGGTSSPYQKVKLDRQIVATAKVHGAKRMLADDKDIRTFAERAGLTVTSTWELPLPPSKTPLLDTLTEPAIELGGLKKTRKGRSGDE